MRRAQAVMAGPSEPGVIFAGTRRAALALVGMVLLGGSLAAHAAPPLEPLFPPAALHGVHGLAFDGSGNLFAAETWGMAVHQVDVATGAIRQVIRTPDGASDDVGVMPAGHPFAGTLVWSANFEGRVMARDPDGKVRVLASDLPAINTIIVAPDGRLFATQTGPVNRLLQIDPAGMAAPIVVLADSGGLNGSVITPDGVLYGPQQEPSLNRIVRLNLATREMQVVAEGFAWPTGVKRGQDGMLYAVDLGTGSVYRLDLATRLRTVIAQFDPGLDNLAVGPDGHVYVSHIPTSSIFDIDPKTSRVRTVVRGTFGVPGGLACEPGEDGDVLYVADLFTIKRVDVKRASTRTLVPLDRRSPFPTNVSVHRDHLVAASLFGGLVTVHDRRTGVEIRRLTGFKSPHDAVELDDGRIVVAESGARTLTIVDLRDARIAGVPLSDDFSGLWSDGSGRLYATATASGLLYRIDLDAKRAEVVARGLGAPEGVALDARGRALVIDRASRSLVAVDVSTGTRTVLHRDLAIGLGAPQGSRPANVFHGAAAGRCAAVYVTSDRDGTIYRMAGAS